MSAIRRGMLLSANSASRPMERRFDDSIIPSTTPETFWQQDSGLSPRPTPIQGGVQAAWDEGRVPVQRTGTYLTLQWSKVADAESDAHISD